METNIKPVLTICGGVLACGILGALVYKVTKNRDKNTTKYSYVEAEKLAKVLEKAKEWDNAGKVIPMNEDISIDIDMFGRDGDPIEYQDQIPDFPDDVDKIVPNVNGGISLEEAMSLYSGGEEIYELIDMKEYMATDDAHRHTCMYFIYDDILAGDNLEVIDNGQDFYLQATNLIMNSPNDNAFVKDTRTGDCWEIIRSESNYLEARVEAGLPPIIFDEEDDA